ncbi:acyl carrier protein [Frankia sp. AgKG'84/4]|uniref:acyl carrier protein n=1 Tax=Frankia sp. AgKG'84/4 TaxID=573490 RepID=UPI0020109394|nr:acyl carrier protein [Frankia sp. AgKG'84/4]MCL9792929.1 acyl carrier protein [Frankia sp. AgKG'84/4]
MNTLEGTLADLLVSRLGVVAEDVTPDSTYEQLMLDSLGLIEFLLIIRKEIGVSLDDDALQIRTTLAETARLVEAKGSRV